MAVDDSHINVGRRRYARRKGSVSQPHRQAMAPGKRKDAADVVAMLVGDQDPGQVSRIAQVAPLSTSSALPALPLPSDA
jgi:hypothetical protein